MNVGAVNHFQVSGSFQNQKAHQAQRQGNATTIFESILENATIYLPETPLVEALEGKIDSLGLNILA